MALHAEMFFGVLNFTQAAAFPVRLVGFPE